jgi:hypothetical protein
MTTGTIGLEQTVSDKLTTVRPYYMAIKIKRASTACLGTFTLSVGTLSAAVNMTDVGTAWYNLEIPIGTGSWAKNIIPTTNTYTKYAFIFVPATNNAAVLYVDHCSFHTYDQFGNVFMSMEQGTADFTYNDTCAYTVTFGTVGNRQKHEAVLNNRYYPHSTSGTVAD